jgi:hypothetical protein
MVEIGDRVELSEDDSMRIDGSIKEESHSGSKFTDSEANSVGEDDDEDSESDELKD